MKTRLLAGIVGLSVLLPSVIWGGPIATWIIIGLACAICLDEYARMAFPDDLTFSLGWLGLSGALFGWTAVWSSPSVAAATAGVVLVATFVQSTLRSGDDLSRAADRAGRYVIGVVWITGLLPMIIRIREWEHGVAWVILTLAISWLGDTGAYFAGRAFGSRKLFESVSPKKTWEGVYGGVATAVLGVFGMRAFFLPELQPIDCVFLGAVGCSMGVLGDLFESLLKRAYGVKDSGWIMPGHGGLLDRIDSVLFVGPTVYAYMVLVRGM